MTCRMPSTSTAYWITERQFKSVCTTTFATLRCTNTSPGCWPVIWFAGTRLSEQPIHRMRGVWIAASSSKNEGCCARTRSAHRRLFSRISRSSAITRLPDVRRPARPRAPHRDRARRCGASGPCALRLRGGRDLRALLRARRLGTRLPLGDLARARTLDDRLRGGRLLRRLAGTRGDDAGAAEQRRRLRGRLGALPDPALHLVLVHLHGERLRHRVVVAEDLDEPAVALTTRVRDHDPVEGPLPRAGPHHANDHRHAGDSPCGIEGPQGGPGVRVRVSAAY